MYKEINSSEAFTNLIDSFWTFSNNKESESFKVLPDNCSDLIFDTVENKAFVSGVMTTYQPRELGINSNLIGIRFKTENFRTISNIPLYEIKDLRVEMAHVIPNYNPNILNKLNDISRIEDKISFLEKFVLKTFNQSNKKQDELILSVVNQIRLAKGVINVKDLAKSYHISLRQLERRFKIFIGLTIKEFSNVVRFKNAKDTISKLTETNLLEIAFDTGFFDHSHMNHEFKRLSGENPSFFR
ncbi:MAG: helix-turn-helix domain-containing protein [Bacteroidota bacterium]